MKKQILIVMVMLIGITSFAQRYDAVVSTGKTIQAAIEAAPQIPKKPYVILIKNGIYNEKVVIDKPNIILVGEDRDSTRIIYAELASKRVIKEYKGKPVGNGVIVLQQGADDCIISGMTVYNNYGSTVEQTTAHQMSIYGQATRTIVINCNVWADGNDALSLWAPQGNGMYYHADLDLRCPGVDFLCPRGWCYATRCTFYGDGRALIWHDGRGDYNKKLVITNSHFDSKTPVTLGRYHHDAQFFLLNCTMTDKIIDHPIGYAYTDKVLDSCPWGNRVYMYNIKREGGNFKWMENNLAEAKGSPKPGEITARWTFGDAWDPEARIKLLWDVLSYSKRKLTGNSKITLPKNLAEAVLYFQQEWTKTEFDEFKNKPERDAVLERHFGTGMWIRNNWIRGGRDTALTHYFHSLGIFHPDDISSIILTSLHRTLNQKDIELDKQIDRFKAYWAPIIDCDKRQQDKAVAIYNKFKKGDDITIYMPVDTAGGYRNAVFHNCPNTEWTFDKGKDLIIKGTVKKKYFINSASNVFFTVQLKYMNRKDTQILMTEVKTGDWKDFSLKGLNIE